MSSRSINKVMLLGNLTRDPQVKYTTGGTAVATFAVATNRTWTTNEGQTKEDVQYHNIVAWSKLAELVGKLLTKGRKVYLEGRLTTRRFTDKNGQERSVTEVVMDDFIVFSDGRKAEGSVSSEAETKHVEATQPAPATSVEDIPMPESAPANDSVNPDDIPF
ncbi:MAG: single-stranded DNA-binding protein [Patescibacteria group bacterium]